MKVSERIQTQQIQTKEFSNKWYCEGPAILALRHIYVFAHSMQIMFTANKFIFVTLFLQGVWAQIYCEGRTKKGHEILLLMVPMFPDTFKTHAQIISQSYLVNLQDNKCLSDKMLQIQSWRETATGLELFKALPVP